jgi:CheY-like chemotaxis protein
MNVGPGGPPAGGGRSRRRRGRRPSNRGGQPGGAPRGDRQQHSGIYSAPMDHSYRAALGGSNGQRQGRSRPGFAPSYTPPDPDPLPQREDAASRIFAFVDDLFFQAKIQETARKLNVKVEFVKTEKDLLERIKQNGDGEKPSLVIFDMNNASAKPLTLIPKLKAKLKKTSIIGFLSHVQGDLKQKAHEVGCDMVLPRSAFSQNLPQLLRRHGAPEEEAAG